MSDISLFATSIPSPFHPPDLPPHPQPGNLLPLHLLPRDGQLPPQPFKTALTQLREPPVQLLLPLALHLCDLPDHRICTTTTGGRYLRLLDFFASRQSHVAVFVVVYVAFQDTAGQGGTGGGVGVLRP